MNNYLVEEELRKSISLIKRPGELFEIRIISPTKKAPCSGYFTDVDVAIEALKHQDLRDCNVYIVLNDIEEGCYSRRQRDKFIVTDVTTKDQDITAREWLFIDIDPKRPKDISSTDEQVKKALDVCGKVHNYLLEQGFPRPIIGFSGNGYHLLYKIQMMNTKENETLIKDFLEALDALFTDDYIKIDKVNSNASRVCKLYGSLAQKGMDTPERPHRMSKILRVPEKVIPVESAYLKKISKPFKEDIAAPNRHNNYLSSDFNLEDWMDKNNIRYTRSSYDYGVKYYLEECPFNSDHTGKDAAIFKMNNGAIGFHCFHNGCYGKTWRDVRIHFEPTAYDKRQQYIEKQLTGHYNRDATPEPPKVAPKDGRPVFRTALDIYNKPKQQYQIIKSGITQFDKQFRGFRKRDVTILSGQTGSAKSTLLSQIVLNAVNAGNNVGVYSGELAEDDYMDWMNLQASNRSILKPGPWENYYEIDDKYRLRIAQWLEGHFWLYDNEQPAEGNFLIEQFEKMIDENKLDMLCIDNLMALDLSLLSKDKYDAQSQLAWKVHELAQRKNVHIIFVCHPRKPTGLLGKYDISGTADLVNAADNVIFTYRVNQDFMNSYTQYFQREWSKGGTNVWHCDKARNGSTDDEYWPLYYEIETKRLKNDISENVIYGWRSAEEERKTSSDSIKQIEFSDLSDNEWEELPWS